ncbi:hypothetical protein M409DRAFT_63908 [Zasmidium cellare ATCC 36951]|uniref:Wings apart-like protein C-terminal domain-containing protein n=1 Tax=Zasmidium cellare ATCC 36951 TaxID=1080233 RepID=A0A6A6CZS4_ZASCE|nr:uncharacterized protein M409DRAFT_63908 [Zasmidium cellare ATCC 36951]KAF2170876.1 hypothetical protein M409DRAFT_63908 [Zasmidium cellare ATCC 36951]
MAEVSAFPLPRRKKPVTYGKASRTTNTWSLDSLKDDDTHAPTPKPLARKDTKVKETYTVSKVETKTHTLKPIKRREQKRDAFDVPSSDDEEDVEPVRRSHAPKLMPGRRHMIEPVPKAKEEPLAPWERKRAGQSQSEKEERARRRKHFPATSDAQLMSELTHALEQDQDKSNVTSPPKERSIEPMQLDAMSPAKVPSPGNGSAAARLRARKQLNGKTIASKGDQTPTQKRPGQDADAATASPRKKLKAEQSPLTGHSDVVMDDATGKPACEHPQVVIHPSTDSMDVYDLPDSSADESIKSTPKVATPKLGGNSRRGKLTTYSRSSPRKMDSAPARLSDMVGPESTDATSPSAANSPTETPPRSAASRVATPETAFKDAGTMTPKQARLWDQLLDSDNSAATPNVLAIRDLTLNTRRVVKTINAESRSFVKSSSDVGPRRRSKLVDRLKASAPSTDAESSDDSDDDTTNSDVEMEDDNAPTPVETEAAQLSQSQSQSQSQSTRGPKVTYASRSRSHLPEDSLEDGLMFSLSSETPQRKGPTSRDVSNKGNPASQKSAFDLDDSGDEAQSGRVQNIHELRASGINIRFASDMDALLQDICDHNASARSRRRTALVDLANKLADNAFAEKFLRQGYEQNLVAEMDTARDGIADLAMASAFATMLAHEVPEHVAPSLRDSGLVSWLDELLQVRVDATKLAKDRRYNMSKSAQRSFVDFATTLKSRELVWGETTPTLISPRIIALKILDNLVGRLRRSGDRSEIVKINDLRHIVPQEDEVGGDSDPSIDVTLAISTLEALSTTALSLAWPSEIVDRLRTVLVHSTSKNSDSQQLLFLNLRLCLNLTNENAKNCKVLAKPPTVAFLLRAVNECFAKLHADVDDEPRVPNLDLLVLSMGILINLTEHNDDARQQATTTDARALLSSLVDVFHAGQQRLIEAESVEQSVTNVAYGYLAVVLANLCRNGEAKALVASKLPGHDLTALVDGLAEFVLQHQTVDTTLEREEGMEVWRAFTEKLKEVLRMLKVEAGMV